MAMGIFRRLSTSGPFCRLPARSPSYAECLLCNALYVVLPDQRKEVRVVAKLAVSLGLVSDYEARAV